MLITTIQFHHKVLLEVILTFFIETLDARNNVVKRLLQEKGYQTLPIESFNNAQSKDCFIFAPNKKFEDVFLTDLPQNTILICGNLPQSQQDILSKKSIKYINIMEDETFAIKNSILTAEGVLANVIEKTQQSIFDQKFLILGTGRSGKAIAKVFSDLNLDFSLSSYDEKNFALAHIFSKNNYFQEAVFDSLKNFDVIINTVPAQIIPQKFLKTIKNEAVFLEIASIQSINTENLHFKYVLCPALPQKFSSISAGEVFFEAIIRALEKTS